MRGRFSHPGHLSKGARGSTCNAAPGRFGSWEITVRDLYKIAASFPRRNPLLHSTAEGVATKSQSPTTAPRERAVASVSRAQYGEPLMRLPASPQTCVDLRGEEEKQSGAFLRRRRRRRLLRLRHNYPAPPNDDIYGMAYCRTVIQIGLWSGP
jgi:hypothetical protein